MKYFTLLLCFFIGKQMAFAQFANDITQSDTSLYWYTSHDPCSLSGCTHFEAGEHFLGNDTIMRGRQYAMTFNGFQTGYFRRDIQGRVYAVDLQDTAENLLYAFNAQTGDTIHFQAFIVDSFRTYFYAIDSIDSILVNGTPRKRMHVSTNIDTSATVLNPYLNLSWIEGVGEEYFGLRSVFVPDITNGFSFCGVYRDSAFVYGAHAACYVLTSVKDLTSDRRIRVYPMPVDDALTIENNTSERLNSFDLLSLSGQSLRTGSFMGQSNGVVSMASIPAGIYFLLIRDERGNIFKQKVVKR